MPRDDWYRNEVWNPEIKKGFLDKLSRARSQRDQYLKIQICFLIKPHPREALRLCELYRDTRNDHSWDFDVDGASAKAYEELDEIDNAVRTYRKLLQHDESQPFFPTSALLDAPFMIARKGRKSDFPFALEALARAKVDLSKQGLRFPVQEFIFQASHALIHHRSKEGQEARDHARRALDAAGVAETGLRYHRKVGLVGAEHEHTVTELKSITSGYPHWLLRLMAKVG